MTQYMGDNTVDYFEGVGDEDDVMFGYGNNDYLIGNGGDDFLDGGDHNDYLVGGAGADELIGGDGIDLAVYGYGNVGVHVNLTTGEGHGGEAEGDQLDSIENVSGTEYDDGLVGNHVANVLQGGGGQDTIQGLGGDDTIDAGGDDDVVAGGTGADTMDGGTGTDWISYYNSASGVYVNLTTNFAYGGEAQGDSISGFENLQGTNSSDILYGSNVANVIRGNAGDDYIWGGAGFDTIYGDAGVDTLGYEGSAAGVVLDLELAVGSGGDAQADIFIGIENLNGTSWVDSLLGNSLRNVFHSGNGMDTLNGRDGNDELHGGSAADTIFGGAGDDDLYGDAGADILAGGLGDDDYYVDNVGDVIHELPAQGSDRIYSSISYTLAVGTEVLQLTGAAAINATGLAATGDTLVGNSGANVIDGKGGNDFIYGKLGNDTLTGGAGNDVFVFDAALGAANKDTITDFSAANDTMYLQNGIFASLAATGVLAAALFKNLDLGAVDASDRILYNDSTGAISYDSDGSGAAAAVQFATLTGNPTITAADFVVI